LQTLTPRHLLGPDGRLRGDGAHGRMMVTDEVHAPDVGFAESARSCHVMCEPVTLMLEVHRSRKYKAKLVALMYVVQGQVGRSHGQT
jgi:hypothetical protein